MNSTDKVVSRLAHVCNNLPLVLVKFLRAVCPVALQLI